MMRKRLAGLLALCLLSATIFAQPSKRLTTCYFAEIPLMIESGILIDSFPPNGSFYLIDGELKVGIRPRLIPVSCDLFKKFAKPLSVADCNNIEYSIRTNHAVAKYWSPLPAGIEIDHFPYADGLIDQFLAPGDSVMLSFRFRHQTNAFREFHFVRQALIPDIIRYHLSMPEDSVTKRIESTGLPRNPDRIPGFKVFNGNQLTIEAGKVLNLWVQKLPVSEDSCLEFRIVDRTRTDTGKFVRTGHLLLIDSLHSDTNYELEIRYAGSTLSKKYSITIEPYKWETGYAIICYMVLSGMLFFASFKLVKKKRVKKEHTRRSTALLQIQKAQSQLNPHFVFNSMNALEDLIRQGETDKAKHYLGNFSNLMRETLKVSDLVFTTLGRDIQMLEDYISIQQLRFEFGYHADIDSRLQIYRIEFPPMLLQPIVENAIKHGVADLGDHGMIIVKVYPAGDQLIVEVQNNGKWKDKVIRAGHGNGLRLTQMQIREINNLFEEELVTQQIIKGEDMTIVRFIFSGWLVSD